MKTKRPQTKGRVPKANPQHGYARPYVDPETMLAALDYLTGLMPRDTSKKYWATVEAIRDAINDQRSMLRDVPKRAAEEQSVKPGYHDQCRIGSAPHAKR